MKLVISGNLLCRNHSSHAQRRRTSPWAGGMHPIRRYNRGKQGKRNDIMSYMIWIAINIKIWKKNKCSSLFLYSCRYAADWYNHWCGMLLTDSPIDTGALLLISSNADDGAQEKGSYSWLCLQVFMGCNILDFVLLDDMLDWYPSFLAFILIGLSIWLQPLLEQLYSGFSIG